MSVGATVRIERAIMSVLSQPGADGKPPLTGIRATGTVTVRATGADVTLPANTYAKAVIASASALRSIDPHRLVKTRQDTLVTAAGVAVPIMSMLGGGNTNLAIGTTLRWDPAVPGVEATSTLTAAMTGGSAPSAIGTVKRMVSFEGIGSGEQAKAFWAAQGPDLFPAVVVSWESADEGQRQGRGRQLQEHRWRIYVVCSRLENDHERRDEGKAILDLAREILCDRSSADGESFSNPPIQLGGMGRFAFAPTSYVYWMDFRVSHSTFKRELRSFAEWTRTNETLQTLPTAAYPGGPQINVVDQAHDMDPETP